VTDLDFDALKDARLESDRRGKALLQLRTQIIGFMSKHHVPETARELMASQTGKINADGSEEVISFKQHGPLEGNNLAVTSIWLQDIFRWMERKGHVTDLDLDAIRARDTNWRDNGRRSESNLACGDRRALLQYIDELEGLVDEIDDGLRAIKRVHREGYQAKPQVSAEEAAALYAEQQTEERRASQREHDRAR
jgi:hypothetical protein